METKKISFGFSKTIKKTNLLCQVKPADKDNKIELIKCLEGKEIKLVEEPKPKELLVIPLVKNQTTSSALTSLMKRRAVLNNEDEPVAIDKANADERDQTKNVNETLEERAARELLSEVVSNGTENIADRGFVLPVLKTEELPLDGASEPTLEDYETVPIKEFGKAMLRGMGWIDPPVEKETQLKSDIKLPRPKGMGLGADKACKPQPLLVQPERNESLEIQPKSYVRVLGGKLKGRYGQVSSFDDYAGRIIVKMAIGGSMEIFNEFMCQPVAKKEYEKYAKCINTAKYEAYKNLENEYEQIILKEGNAVTSTVKGHSLDKNYINKEASQVKEDTELLKNIDYKTQKSHYESTHEELKTEYPNPRNYPVEYKNSSNPPFRDESNYKKHSSTRRHGSSDSNSSMCRPTARSEHKSRSNRPNTSHKNKKSKGKPNESDSENDNSSSEKRKRHKSHKKSKKGRRKQSRSRSRSRR